MYRSSLFLTAALMGATIALVQPMAAAKSASEVEDIAKAVVVEIRLQKSDTVGSGVIIDRVASPAGNRKGDLYTLVTNKHVVCGDRSCSKLPAGESYRLSLAGGQQYQVKASNIKLLGNDLDLAIIQFRSDRNYAVAKLADPGNLKTEDDVYTAGFPFEQPGFAFGEGKAIAVVNKRLTGDGGGYTIIYDAATLPGMSGGGVFDANGQLVAIHGQGDRYRDNTLIDDKSRVDSKIGLNRGIPIRWLVQNLAEVGINLRPARSISGIRAARAQVSTTADEYFISGFNKSVEPGDNVVAGKQQAIQDFSAAIRLNPKYQYAYFARAVVYQQVNEFQQSRTDYNQAILINPKYSEAYNNRAILKADKLNDIQGALADYNQAILLDPKKSKAYYNRAILKADKLKNIQGALADFNQVILLDPKESKAYYNRAVLKADKLNDVQGALADYNQAILLDPKESKAYYNRAILKADKLKNIQGGLADYNQAILINPKYSAAYNNRAALKADELNDIQGALADYNQAILINLKDFKAYYNRAVLKENKLNDIQGGLADYNQAILINPKYSAAYNNRAVLKEDKLNDIQGALADYNQAILINLKDFKAYYNRAVLKENKLNDIQGGLADYNQAILINPKYSLAYNNRAVLKYIKLNDRAGAIQDLRQAARLFREQGNTQKSQLVIRALQQLGATE
jgi:tetratricopeptide (TPR) repeat protein